MNVGLIGSGRVGRTLGAGFVAHGHRAMVGSRDPEKPELLEWRESTGENALLGTFAEAARFGELLVFCPKWSGAENAFALAGPANFAGKIVIDTSNPIGTDAQGRMIFLFGGDSSAAEQVQAWAPRARVVKALNYVGVESMVDPVFPGGPPSAFIAGDDEGARDVVAEILRDFGWDPVDMGELIAARNRVARARVADDRSRERRLGPRAQGRAEGVAIGGRRRRVDFTPSRATLSLPTPHRKQSSSSMPDDDRELLARFMDSLFRDAPCVSRLDVLLRAQTYDLPEVLFEIVNNLPPVPYTRYRLADQLNSAIVGHGLSRRYGTVE